MKKFALAFVLLVGTSMQLTYLANATATKKETLMPGYSPMLTSNEITCLTGTYKGSWGGQTIILEIIDARYNNMLSLRGTISGYVKYKKKVYPVKGSLRYKAIEKKFEVNIGMVEYDAKNNVSFDFDGTITCYTNGTGNFRGVIITPGYSHPEMQDIVLRK